MKRKDCEFNKDRKGDPPCFTCRLGLGDGYRDNCPYLSAMREIERLERRVAQLKDRLSPQYRG
jgi:hypothetical protein